MLASFWHTYLNTAHSVQNSEAMDASQDASQAGATDPQLEPSQTETAEPSGPDHRAHVDKNYINPSMVSRSYPIIHIRTKNSFSR